MPPEHEHGFSALAIQLLEQNERFLFQAQTALLIPINNVESVLPPVGVDVVLFERCREDFMTRVFHADAEGFENFDAGRFAVA